jgi:Domain of unknown function (DUF4410)
MHHRVLTFLCLFLAGMTVRGTLTAANQAPAKKLAGYTGIVVEKFTVDQNPATEDFPKGLDVLMQGRAVEKLREQKLFEQVVDGAAVPADKSPASKPAPSPETAAPPAQPSVTGAAAEAPKPAASAGNERRLILSGTVLIFDKGSRAARYWVGFGAGQAKMKVRFTFRDAQTGTEVMRFDQQGTFKGAFSAFGGGQDEALVKAASGVVKGLISEIIKNR